MMDLQIREVTADNWAATACLSVNDNQKDFIESNSFSLAQSKFEPQWNSVGLYDGPILVGYAMYGREKKKGSVWLDRFMIDQKYQGNGYASRFLALLIEKIHLQYACHQLYLSIFPENKVAQGLYEKFGFKLNGEIDEDGFVQGLVMVLDLTSNTDS